jgi:hypothetical protein
MEELINTSSNKDQESLAQNMDVMAIVTSYLNRKDKFKLTRLCRDFKYHIVPRTMVSLAFKGI